MSYSYKRSITIDYTKVPNTNQTDFPVLVAGTYSYLATVSNGGKVTNANGYDVAFYSDSALTTQLKHETELWTAATGVVVYWVKIPTLSYTANTVFYMAYGNSAISTDQSDKVNVWDANYKGVWHLGDGTTLTVNDSTAGANNGTNSGGTATDLKIDGAIALSGTSLVSVAWPFTSDFETQIENGTVTFSAWVNSSNYSAERGIIGVGNSGSNGLNFIQYSNKMYFWYSGGTLLGSTSSLTNGVTYHLTGVAESLSSIKFYINGALDRTASTDLGSFNLIAVGSKLYIGEEGQAPGKTWQGSLDEVRISNSARSADWITTEYNSQSSPSTFYAVGNEVGAKVGPFPTFLP